MENLTNKPKATFESVWASLQETDRMRKESDARWEKSRAEYDQQLKESRAEYEKMRKESDERWEKSRADYDRRMKKFEETMGGWSNNHGDFAEEYFFNSFENGKQNFFGETFDEIEKNVKGIKKGYKDEYDILLINGHAIGIVEVKFKAHKNDIPKILQKSNTFRVNFPEFENHRVYLGLATMAFNPELEQDCIDEGIAVIKQVGDTVVINDEHLKVF